MESWILVFLQGRKKQQMKLSKNNQKKKKKHNKIKNKQALLRGCQ